jgi:hypothetical protein
MAFSNTKTALAHSISLRDDAALRPAARIACSFTLPMVLERAVGADPGRDAVLAAISAATSRAPAAPARIPAHPSA